jgi:uncharacterized protein YhaN
VIFLKINKLKINSYGKLKNKEIELKDKINIIYGENESGKSTILRFIVNSLYGTSKNKNGKDISDYEKYKPWNSDDFSGKMEYELDNGEKFEIYREFGKKNPKIFNEKFEDISKEFNIDKNKGNEFFYEQTKVDEKLFLATSVIGQQEVKIEKNIQNILVQKISNLVGTGEDNVSYKKAIEKLNKKQLDEVGTDRSREKPINIAKQEIEKLQEEKNDLENNKENLLKLDYEKNILSEKIKEEEIENNLIKEIKKIKENEKLDNEKIKIKEKINYENIEKIKKLNIEKNNLIKNNKINIEEKKKFDLEKNNKLKLEKIKKEKNSFNKKIIISIIIFLMLDVLVAILLPKIVAIGGFLLTLIIEIGYYKILKNRFNLKIKEEEKNEIKNQNINDDKINQVQDEIYKLESEINLLEKAKNNLDDEINKIKKEINLKINLDKEKIKNIYLDKIELNTIDFLFNSQNINFELEKNQNQLYENKIKENRLEIEKENLEKKLNKLVNIEEKLVYVQNDYVKLKSKNESIELAKNILNIAYENMKKNISPRFTKMLSDNIENITGGRYNNVRYNDEEGLLVELHNGNYVTAEKLSIGTIEQLYLSLRFAILTEISEENIPIILDETFAYYDNNRLKNILKYFSELYEKKQIIIFTCTNREKEILDELKLDYNFIEI